MGTGPDDRRSVGTRIRRRRYPPVHGGGLDAAVLAVSQQCGSSHRRDEKGGVDHAQPRKRFQRTAHSRGASLFTWPARTHGQESSLVAAPARTDNQETSLVAAPGSAVLTGGARDRIIDRKSTRLNSSHSQISYAVFCLKKKNMMIFPEDQPNRDSVISYIGLLLCL